MIEQAVEITERGTRFLVTCHRRPDADALGSALGFAAILRHLGKEPVVYVPDEPAPQLRFLTLAHEIVGVLPDGMRFDATFVMDTAARRLLPKGLPSSEVGGPPGGHRPPLHARRRGGHCRPVTPMRVRPARW